jgi:hypothetical protein
MIAIALVAFLAIYIYAGWIAVRLVAGILDGPYVDY